MPGAAGWGVDGILAGPILDEILRGEGSGPVDAHGVDFRGRGEVKDDPLRVGGLGLVREALGEVGITFPVGVGIAVGEARVSGVAGAVVAREAAMRKAVAVRKMDGLVQIRGTGEVALAFRIAPGALRVPVPGFDEEFGVLAVTDSLPSGGEDLAEVRLAEEWVEGLGGEAVDARAEGLRGREAIGGVGGSDVDVDVLGGEGCGEEGDR